MAEGAGIDFTFKVRGDELVAVVNGQVIALGKLKEATDSATQSTEALAEQSQNLEKSQEAVTASSGRLNRSLAGQLTAVSRLQGGVAGLLPGLASWTYLIRRLAIASRGVLSLNPQWIILAGAITAVGGAFKMLADEAERANEKAKEMVETLMEMEYGRSKSNMTATQRALALRERYGNITEEKRQEEWDKYRERADVSEQGVQELGEQIEDAESALQRANRLLNYRQRTPVARMGGQGREARRRREEERRRTQANLIRTFLNERMDTSKLDDDQMVASLKAWQGMETRRVQELKKQRNDVQKEFEANAETRDWLDSFESGATANSEKIERKKREEAERKLAESLTSVYAQAEDAGDRFEKQMDNRERMNSLLASGDAQGVRDWISELQNTNAELLDKINYNREELPTTTDIDVAEAMRDTIRASIQEYGENDALISQLEKLGEQIDKLNETIEDKFSIFEKTWGGENEIESHGGRITDYDPYGGLSYSLNTTDLERRQLEAQQSIQRSANQIATEGVPVRL